METYNPKLKEQMENEIEEGLRKSLEETPLILLEDCAEILKNAVARVCDEYIEKGRQYKEQWALETVRRLLNIPVAEEDEENGL